MLQFYFLQLPECIFDKGVVEPFGSPQKKQNNQLKANNRFAFHAVSVHTHAVIVHTCSYRAHMLLACTHADAVSVHTHAYCILVLHVYFYIDKVGRTYD